ncbi:MAG: hypothetical protein ACYST2_04810 [Planctomycetota bacterium]|jgi:predicted transcriptional regulator
MKDEQWLAFMILNYLFDRPTAKDTFQGIAHWWVSKQQITHDVKRVSKALAILVDNGLVKTRHYKGQEVIYQLNYENYDQIAAAIKNMTENSQEVVAEEKP